MGLAMTAQLGLFGSKDCVHSHYMTLFQQPAAGAAALTQEAGQTALDTASDSLLLPGHPSPCL